MLDVTELKRVDIVNLAKQVGFTLVERGNKYTTEEHDSLILYPDDNSWHRFSDDAGGDAIAFLMYWQRLDFKEACARLQNLSGILPLAKTQPVVVPPPPPELPQDEHLRYHRAMRPDDRGWWMEHYGVSEEAMERFYLGACREGRFAPVTYTIPVFRTGRLVNIKHRIPDAPHGSKYRNHRSGVGTQLFNGDRLTPDCREIVVVAGEMKAVVLEDFGIPAVSATGGCSNWRDEWTAQLQHCERIYVAFDPEPAEERKHAVNLLTKLDARARLVACPQKPDDFVLDHGADAFRDLLATARTLQETKAWDAALVKARRTVRI